MILDEATSALDAESETLVNQALHSLLEGNNTTISIAHRLSTIQRSDRIICIGSDGKVAQQGTFKELSNQPDGAFAKLMEWQMSGGEAPVREAKKGSDEEELMRRRLEEHDNEDGDVEDGTKVRGDDKSAAEAVLEKAKDGGR